MKKLIAMIGAVAMSFGLFAATTSLQTSFEAADGVEGSTWTPGTGWTWTGNPLTVNTYDGDAYEYPTSGQAVRRSGFLGGDLNTQYIKLETGKDTLVRDCAEGDLVLDQLVQFTGFEEMQESFDGAKIAIWKAGMADDDDVVTNKNLYVTVGSVEGSVALSLGDTYQDNKWYRLTIKSIKNIMKSGTRAGFLVYIDGEQVASVDDAAKFLFDQDALTPEAAALMAEKKLFPAMTTDNATFASVGYMGIGAIDDVVIDDEGPLFVQTVDFTVTVPANFAVAAVTNLDTGVAIELKDNKYTAGTGANIGITVVANGPVVMDPTEITKTAANGTLAVTADDLAGKYKDADVSLTRDTETTYFTQDGFVALLLEKGAVVDGDVIEVLNPDGISKEDEELGMLYSFTPGTTIEIEDVKDATDAVIACKWNVTVPDYETARGTAPGELIFNLGIEPEKQIEVTFDGENAEDGTFTFKGAIAGQGAYLKVNNGTADLSDVTLVDDAKVYVKEQLTIEDVFTNADEIKEEQEGDFYVYSIQQATGFAIIIAGDVYKYFPTLQAAINAAGEGEYADYKTVTIVDNFALDTGVVVDKEVTIDFNGKTMTATYATTKDAYVPPINVLAGGDLTIKGNGSIVAWDGDAAAALDTKPVIRVEGALTYLNGTLTTGGAADCGLYGVGIFNGGEATFGDDNGGPSITSWFAAVAANNLNAPVAVTINNGSYTQLANGEGQNWSYFCGALYAAAQGTYTINGGTFDGALYSIVTRYNDVETVIDIEDGTFNDAMLVGELGSSAQVKGTRVVTKDEEVTLALAGSDHYWFDGTTLGKKSDAVAKIDDDYFMTLPKAIAAAAENDTITLLNDLELTTKADMIKFPAGFKGTLNLGGKTIERTASNDYVIQVQSGADLTITGTGLIKFEPVKLGYTTSTYAKITGLGAPSSMIDVANSGALTIAGGTFQTDYCCVKTEELGELSITGGALEILTTDWLGLTFAVMNWGDAEITGGDFDGNVQVCAYIDNGVTYAGDLTIDGGTFQPATVYLLSYNDTAFPVAQVKNSIAENFTDPVYVDYGAGDGIEATTTAGDTYTTYTLAAIPQAQVAKIGTKTYPTLAAAFEDAKGDESVTIELLGDLTEDVNVTGVNARLDLGGFTLTGAMSVAGTLTIANGTNHFVNADFAITGGKLTLAADAVLTGWYSNESIKITNGADFDIYGKILIDDANHGNAAMAVVIMDDSDGSVVNAYEGCVIESGVTIFKSRCGGDNSDAEVGTINVYGGTFTQTSSYGSMFYGSKKGYTTFNIVGGTFNMVNGGSMFYSVTGANNTITGLDGNCTAKFSKDPLESSGYAKGNPIAEGYGAVEGDDGYFMIKKVWDVTLINGEIQVDKQVVADGACATNVTLAVDGFKGWTNETYTAGFNFATPIEADLTLYAWIEAADPIVPGQDEKTYKDEAEAQKAAESRVVVPTETAGMSDADIAAFNALFTKTAVQVAPGGAWKVEIAFTTAAAAALQPGVDAANTAIAAELSDSTKTEFAATIPAENVKPGLWYGIAAQEDVTGMANAQPAGDKWVQAKAAGALELPPVAKPSTAKGFFKVVCAPMPTPANPAE